MRSVSFAFVALVLFPSLASAGACIWFADANSIKQLNTDDNSVVAHAALREPHRLAMNASDCGVWALHRDEKRLVRVDAAGNEVRSVRLRQLDRRLDEAEHLQIDAFDDSLWIGDERRLFHLGAEADRVLGSFRVPGEISALRVALDQTLWVLGKRKLWRFDAEGNLIAEWPLERALRHEAKHFAVDDLRSAAWIVGRHQVARLDTGNPDASSLVVEMPDAVTAFALDPITGRVWLAHRTHLEALNPDGSPFARIELKPLGLSKPEKLAFDPASRSLFAGFERRVVRFTDAGEFVAAFRARDGDEVLGVPAFKIEPRIALEHPAENGLLNQPRPEFRLAYSAHCNDKPCESPASYLSGMSLEATLNGKAVGDKFVFDPDAKAARFTPAYRLPEGISSFFAQASDAFGHGSNELHTTFTVDTIPPRFGPFTPPPGSVLATPQTTLRGSVNEAGVSVILENAQGLNPQGPNPQFPQPPGFPFSWGLTLLPGSNPIQLSAVDPAGNVASTVHTLVFSGAAPQAPQVAIQSPANGATIADDNATVSGTWSGPPNTGIVVNGLVAATNGNQYFASIPLTAGLNTITASAIAPDGTRNSSTIQVTSTGPSPTRVSTPQLGGFAPFTGTFTITSDRPIQHVGGNFAVGFQICFEEGEIFCFEPGRFFISSVTAPLTFTYEQPGVYEARFNITHTDGTTVTKTLRIVVQTIDQIDQQLRQVWGGLTSALVRGNKAEAMQYLNTRARQKYGPVFDALLPNMPQIVASFASIQLSSLEGGVGEYGVKRTNAAGVTYLYLIYFVQDDDGVWRLDTM